MDKPQQSIGSDDAADTVKDNFTPNSSRHLMDADLTHW